MWQQQHETADGNTVEPLINLSVELFSLVFYRCHLEAYCLPDAMLMLGDIVTCLEKISVYQERRQALKINSRKNK